MELTFCTAPACLWEQPFPLSWEQAQAWDSGGALSWFSLHQDLVFDLGDPVRWEYMLLGTDKPHLSMADEDDEGLDDDDDIDDLVSRMA